MTDDQLEQQRREQTRRDIEDDAQRWASGFGGLDERSLPIDLQKAAQDDEPVAEYDRHGFPTYDTRGLGGNGKNALKQWLTAIEKGEIDDSTAADLAQETNDPKLLADHHDRVASKIASEWVQAHHSDYWPVNTNWKKMREALCELVDLPSNASDTDLVRAGAWTQENLTQAFEVLKQAGEIAFRPGTIHQLSEAQRQQVKAELHANGPGAAVETYFSFAIGSHAHITRILYPNTADGLAKLLGSHAPALREAVAHVFWLKNPGFRYTPERWQWLNNYVADRLPTVPLLEQAWQELQKQEQQEAARAERHHLVYGEVEEREEVPIAEGLENLSDAEIDGLLRRTRVDIAKRSRRSPGVIL